MFSDPWARAWCAELNQSDGYRKAAAEWRGSIVLVATVDGPGTNGSARSVFADLPGGACREARAATPADLEAADFVISGAGPVWKALLDRRIEPIPALMRGQLKLARGSLGALVRHVVAAQELVAAAARVETEFPQAWRGEG